MFSLFIFILTSLGCVASANLIRTHPTRIIDFVHEYLPTVNSTYLSDILVFSQVLVATLLTNLEQLNEMLLIMSCVQFFRSICLASTVLPPLRSYEEKYRMGGLNGSGTEYIFSGHASYSALTAIYLYNSNRVSIPLLTAYNLFSQYLIVATKNHYTIDVILAWIIVPLVYGNYQFLSLS
jgi:hypothetical protein